MNGLISWIQRRTAFILWASFLLSIFGGYYTVKLYGNLRTDVEELLPTTSRSVRDLDEVARRLKSIDNLAVLVFSKDTQASKRFVTDLAKQIETYPSNEVAGVEYRIDSELAFFKKREALYLDKRDLKQIRDYIRDRIQYETELYNPLNIFAESLIAEPKLDFGDLQKKYESRARDYAHFPGGFFATPDETKRAVLIDVVGKTLGIEGAKRLRQRVDETISRLRIWTYAPDLEVRFTGGVQEMLEEQEALVEDLAWSTVAVIILVTVVMLVFFQSLWYTVALILSLFASTLWTFGASFFAVGYLNANSAFLGSIVLGNGLNFGTIFLARYIEERRSDRGHLKSCNIAMASTWKATLTAALAAGLSYGSLMLTSFRGFSQFGVIGLIGMALCWGGAYTLLPALLTLVDRWKPMPTRAFGARKGAIFTRGLAAAITRWPKPIAVVSTVATVVSLFYLGRANSGLLETNLEHLRSKRSVESGAGFYARSLNEIFGRFLTPIVVLPHSRENAAKIAERLKELKKSQDPGSPIVSVQTIDDFVPGEQKEKIALLKEIRNELRPRVMAGLSTEDRHRAEALLAPDAFKPFGLEELPPLVRQKFMEKDGTYGKMVLVEPTLSKDIWNGENLENFIEGLRKTSDSVEPGVPVAGGMAITSDLVSSIARDGPKATLLAFIAAVLLVVVLFREPKTVALALFALLIGVAWFGGLVVWLSEYGLRINFLNFVALPITFGIGVDYGINIFQSYRVRRGDGGIVQILRETGGAVGLCSVTTIIGYSSLLMASNRGFISFGLLAVLGETTCVIAALVALPAVLASLGESGARARRAVAAGATDARTGKGRPGSAPEAHP